MNPLQFPHETPGVCEPHFGKPCFKALTITKLKVKISKLVKNEAFTGLKLWLMWLKTVLHVQRYY